MASLLLVLVASQVIVPSASAATFAGKNGKIAFTRIINGTPTIWTMREDGSHRGVMVRNGFNPVWSPSGRDMAIVSTVNGQSRLQVINAHGEDRRNLTDGTLGNESTPAWSKDGRRIAFVSERTSGGQTQSAVFTIHRSGAHLQNISGWVAGIQFRSPSWSPEADKITYEQSGAGHAVLIKDIVNDKTKVLVDLSDPDHPANVSWSPNGKKILFSDSATEIYTMWPDGTHRAVISDGESYHASWSPDGECIAFIEDPEGDTVSISGKDGSITWIQIDKANYKKLGKPVWSPDGAKLIFTMSRDNMQHDIFSLDIESHAFVKSAENVADDLAWQRRSK